MQWHSWSVTSLFVLRIKRNVLTALQKACLSRVPCPAVDGKRHTERRAGQSLPTKKNGKEQGKGNYTVLLCTQAGLFCSTRALLSSILPSFSYTISLIKGEGVGPRTRDYFRILLSKLYPQNSCEVANSPAIIWIASPDCTFRDTALAWPTETNRITNRASSYSSWDKTSPSWKCMFFFTGLKIRWHDYLKLGQ